MLSLFKATFIFESGAMIYHMSLYFSCLILVLNQPPENEEVGSNIGVREGNVNFVKIMLKFYFGNNEFCIAMQYSQNACSTWLSPHSTSSVLFTSLASSYTGLRISSSNL